MRIWNNYGVLRIKIETVTPQLDVTGIVAADTLVFLPFENGTPIPTGVILLNNQPFTYFSDYVQQYEQMGSAVVGIYDFAVPAYADPYNTAEHMRFYLPYTGQLNIINNSADPTVSIDGYKITDIASGNYYYIWRDGAAGAAYVNNEYIGNISLPFAIPGSTNLYSASVSIENYVRDGDEIEIVSAHWLGVRTISNNANIYLASDGIPEAALLWLNAAGYADINADPYEAIPESGPGGYGDGTFNFESTPIDFQGLPTIGAMDTGMIDLYVPSAGQLAALSNYLWAGAFDPDNFKKLLADPMDAIIGLSIVPVSASEIGTAAATLAVGNISTGLSMPKALRQYVSVDCGSVSVLPKYGAYLDFAPNSKLQLFLPYIGIVDISPDDCMNGSISVRYSVDILGGMCVAQVKCNDHVLYEFSGTCSCACPVTAGQYQNVALTALKVAGSVAGMVGGGAAGIAAGLENAANSIISSAKPEIQRSGGFGGSSGLMGHQIPFLILTVPKMARPGEQNRQMGYPSFVTKTLGDLAGYVQIETIHLAGVPATDAEQDEIVQLLQGGVYL